MEETDKYLPKRQKLTNLDRTIFVKYAGSILRKEEMFNS